MDPIGNESLRVTGKKMPTKLLDWIAILEQVPIQLLYIFVANRGWTTTQLDGDYNKPLQGTRHAPIRSQCRFSHFFSAKGGSEGNYLKLCRRWLAIDLYSLLWNNKG